MDSAGACAQCLCTIRFIWKDILSAQKAGLSYVTAWKGQDIQTGRVIGLQVGIRSAGGESIKLFSHIFYLSWKSLQCGSKCNNSVEFIALTWANSSTFSFQLLVHIKTLSCRGLFLQNMAEIKMFSFVHTWELCFCYFSPPCWTALFRQ